MALLCTALVASASAALPHERRFDDRVVAAGGDVEQHHLDEVTGGDVAAGVYVEQRRFDDRYHRSSFMQHRHRNAHHRLRICNAYPNRKAFDVFQGRRIRLTEDEPLAYKACRDFTVGMKVGEKLEFRLGDHSAGIFVVQSMPSDESVLLLVVRRTKNAESNAVAFTSHLFAPHESAQVAVVDTYTGTEHACASIGHVWPQKQGEPASNQLLKYNSMVTIGQGMYEVNISGSNGHAMQRSQLVALSHESYVILRTGLDADDGDSFPDELIVYPLSDASQLPKPNGAQAKPWLLSAAVALIVFAFR